MTRPEWFVRTIRAASVARDFWTEALTETAAETASVSFCPIRFQGQWEDAESGLYQNRFRYYDPTCGHYVSPDPIGILGGTLRTAYTAQPAIFVDPHGLYPLEDPGWSLYHIVRRVNGRNVVCYVGITRDISARRQQHANSGLLGPGLDLVADTSVSNVRYATARGAEQADIDFFQTRNTDFIGQPVYSGDPNRVNSVAPDRTGERGEAFHRARDARNRSRCCAGNLSDYVQRTDEC